MNIKSKLMQSESVNKVKKAVKFFLGIPLTLIAFYFIVSFIAKSYDSIIQHLVNSNIFLLTVGMIFLLLFFFLKGFAWRRILENLGYEVETLPSVFEYSLAETKRYIPGNIFSFVSRVKSGEKLKVPSKVILKSIGIEILLLVLSSLFVAIPGIIFSYQVALKYIIDQNTGNIQIFSNINLYSFLILYLFLGTCYLLYKLKKRFNVSIHSFIKRYLDVFFISGLAWFFFGIGNYCIVTAINFLEPYFFIQYVSFFVLSWLIGYVSFITPMGLGVREGIVTLGLTTLGGLPLALSSALSIITRFVLIVTELLFLLIIRGVIFFKKLRPFKLSYDLITLCISILAYNAYFIYVTTQKHINFFTGRFDLGNMDQTVWNTLHGKIFLLTNPDGTNIISRLGIHADFILILLAPFYLIWENPQMLLVIQTVVLSFGAVFVFLLTKDVINNRLIALALSISFLLSPLVQRQNLYDFHAVALATTFLMGAFYFLVKRKLTLFLIFLSLAALTKENVFLIVSMFGIYCFFNKRRVIGTLLFILGIVVFYVLVNKFIPDARGGAHFALEYFGDFGDSTASVAKNIILKPYITFPILFSQDTFDYLIKLFLSTGFVSLLSPFYMLFTAQDLAVNLLSKNDNLRSINFQYTATLIPFIYISSVYGIKRLLSFRNPYVTPKTVFYYLLFFSIFSQWMNGILPGSRMPSLDVFNKQTNDKEFINSYLKNIPKDKSVAATNNVGAHLSHRDKIYTIPTGVNDADILVFLLTDIYAQPSLEQQYKMVEDLEKNPQYRLKIKRGPFVVFEKLKS